MSESCDEGALPTMTNTNSNTETHLAASQQVGMTASVANSSSAPRQLRLAALPTAPRMARVLIDNAVSAWGIKEDPAETAKLLMSELATNAVRHTGRAEGTAMPGPTEYVAVIYVRAELHEGMLRLAVWDNDTSVPVLQELTDGAEGGRGLFLVESLASRWGHYFPPAGGKVVWADVPLVQNAVPQVSTANTWWPLPKRVPQQAPETNAARSPHRADVEMLERELWSLQRP
jgi:anti-sigma regulatory factor (Ser/Thr protein kinase)